MCSTLIMDGGEVVQNTATKTNTLLMTSFKDTLNHREETTPLSSPNSNPNDDRTHESQSEDDISVGCPSPALSCGVTITQTDKLYGSESSHHYHHHHHNGSRSSSPFSPAREDVHPSDEDSRSCEQDDYFKPLKKLKMMQIDKELAERQSVKVLPPEIVEVPTVFSNNSQAGVKSFSILDILSHRPSKSTSERATSEPNATQSRIVRPWDLGTTNNVSHHHLHRYHHHSIRPKSADFCYTSETLSSSSGRSSAGGSVASSDCCTSPDIINCTLSSPTTSNPGLRHAHRRHPSHHQARSAPTGKATTSKGANTSPLDALFQMTSKTFDELNGEAIAEGQANHLNLFNNRQQAKKKRKSRTAFTNHQIFELEKRFLYQKYLSPADRDEIAGQLGLSNAQVITWFQNRRAKLKRDMEELKKDVESAKVLTAHKSFLENVQDLGILKKKAATNAILADEKRLAAMALSLAPPIVK